MPYLRTAGRNSGWHQLALICLAILVSMILTSCGGGGSTAPNDPNATAQSVDDGTKTIQGVSGSTTVPGTWTGRAPKMEVINSITVPPEPAPAINNATLAGVDVNNNGVRDDVERKVALISSNKSQFDRDLQLTKAYQSVLNPQSNHQGIAKAILCAVDSKYSSSLIHGGDGNVIEIVFNNPARRRALVEFNNLTRISGSGECQWSSQLQ